MSGKTLVSLLLLLTLCLPVLARAQAARSDIVAGTEHILALKADGTVWSWGGNTSNQLGAANEHARILPARVANIEGAVAVAAGDIHNLVLLANGEVLAWGNNSYGQLGDGSTTHGDTPAKVKGLADVVAIAAGGFSNLALKRDGTVWGWGSNQFGQVGDGTTADAWLPVQVAGLVDIAGVAVCRDYSGCGAALGRDGSVWTWGNNTSGQLGDGDSANRPLPARIAIDQVTRLAAGSEFFFAERQDGSVWAWGRNSEGSLGDGGTTNRRQPATVTALQGHRLLAGGLYHGLALAADGSLRAWGQNAVGEVGDGTTTTRTAPVPVVDAPGDIVALAGGHWFSAALTTQGTLYTWGANSAGQLGRGLLGTAFPFARKIAGFAARDISAGDSHTLALDASGAIWSWGANSHGQLGQADRVAATQATPTLIPGLTASAIAACQAHSLALTADGEVYAWGDNGQGQLGDSGTTVRATPVKSTGLSDVRAIACGDTHSLALAGDGRVWAWGANWYGQLGNGAASGYNAMPAPISGLADIAAIAAGGNFNLVLARDGTVYGWGADDLAQLGDGGGAARTTPVALMLDADAIVAGHAHAFARGRDGLWRGWGRNLSGQLGLGDQANRTTATLLALPATFSALAANGGTGGAWHVYWNWGQSYGLAADGAVWSWGAGSAGQLGAGDTADRALPGRVPGLPAITRLAAGKTHALALSASGELWAWGDGADGKLGARIDFTRPGHALSDGLSGSAFDLGRYAAATLFEARALLSGTDAAPGIVARLAVAPADRGKHGKLFVAARLPDGQLFFLTPENWLPYVGGALPVWADVVLGEHEISVWSGGDLSGLGGTTIYAGYGQSESDMLDNGKHFPIHRLP